MGARIPRSMPPAVAVAIRNAYLYGAPLHEGADVATRRQRIAALIRVARRRGWRPKLGLLRARRRGPAFSRERERRVTTAYVDALLREAHRQEPLT